MAELARGPARSAAQHGSGQACCLLKAPTAWPSAGGLAAGTPLAQPGLFTSSTIWTDV